jgi:hypothetical protein
MQNQIWRVLSTFLIAALVGSAQQPKALPETAAIESAVNRLFEAIHQGNPDAARSLFSKEAVFYNTGGAAMSPFRRGAELRWAARKDCSLYLRHVQLVTPESSLAVGIRHCPSLPPTEDSGILDLTLRKENGAWKFMSWREGLAKSPHLTAMQPPPEPVDGSGILSPAERKEGWQALFDGKTSRGWLAANGDSNLPSGWKIEQGSLATVAGSGVEQLSIQTRDEFTNFDLRFEWRVGENANSGCIYRRYMPESGWEYQVADDDGDPGARVDLRQKSGALYGVVPVPKPAAKPVGEWNSARILVTAHRVEHWLNGERTAEYPIDVPFLSAIVLQHHFSEVRFRNLRIRPLP